MSLTHDEWEDVWRQLETLESYVGLTSPHVSLPVRVRAENALKSLKGRVESVIGQMETNPQRLRPVRY